LEERTKGWRREQNFGLENKLFEETKNLGQTGDMEEGAEKRTLRGQRRTQTSKHVECLGEHQKCPTKS
jgi:hypothetical protein